MGERGGGGGGLERFRKGKEEGRARKRAKLANKKKGRRPGHARRRNCVGVSMCVCVCAAGTRGSEGVPRRSPTPHTLPGDEHSGEYNGSQCNDTSVRGEGVLDCDDGSGAPLMPLS